MSLNGDSTENIEDLVEIVERQAALNQGLDALVGARTEGLGDLVDILGFDNSLEIILKQLGEVVWRHTKSASVNMCEGTREGALCSSDPRKYLMTSSQSGGLSNLPRFGLSLPLRILSAVLLPIPLVPTRPRTLPGRGMGRRCSLKLLAE